MDLQEQIRIRLEALKNVIQAKMQSEGVNASGRTSASLTVRSTADGVELVKVAGNNAPMATLEVGRNGGRVPVGFRHILAQWSRDKGIGFGDEAERNTFAFFLAKRIAREGTLRHANNVNVYSSLVAEAVKDLTSIVSEGLIKAIKQHNVNT